MIKILQTGQVGSTKYLLDMHRVRTKIFRDRMGWDVSVNDMELEIDEYDLPQTIYILSTDEHDKVVGTWRILLTTEPSMIRDIWPHYLSSLPIPYSENMCEASRFGVYSSQTPESRKIVNKATAEMIVGLIDVCIKCGITDMYTLYDIKVKRLLERIGFAPARVSEVIDLEGKPTVTAHFRMDDVLLENVCSKTGVDLSISPNELPPMLLEKYLKHQVSQNQELEHA